MSGRQVASSGIRPRHLLSIADIKTRADIVGRHVSMQQRGPTEHWACCPFHDEKHASCKVDRAWQRFKCYSGDVIDFLAQIDGLDQAGAIRRLREMGNMPGTDHTVQRQPTAIQPDRMAEERRELAQAIWRQSEAIQAEHELPWRFLTETRGISRPGPRPDTLAPELPLGERHHRLHRGPGQ